MKSSEQKKEKVRAILMLEILGKPAEYLNETLNEIIAKIGEEKNVRIVEKKIAEPKEIEQKPGFYSSFAEVEVETSEIIEVVILTFKYMPAHVEIISPESIGMTNVGWADILSEITRRLHGYEEVLRMMQFERNIMEKKLRDIIENNKDLLVGVKEEDNLNSKEEKKKETKKKKKN